MFEVASATTFGQNDDTRQLVAKFRVSIGMVSTGERDKQIPAIEDVGSLRVELSIGTEDRSVKAVVMR